MLNMQAIFSSLVSKENITWGVTSNLLMASKEQLLIDRYPKEGFVRQLRDSGSQKHYSFSLLNLIIDNAVGEVIPLELDRIWIELANNLMSKTYVETLSQKLAIDLRDCKINIGFYRFDKGDWVSPHIDNPDKILTQIFYFNSRWSMTWGGFFRVLNSQDVNDVGFSLAPLANFSALIARSESAWHMVTPVTKQAEEPRLSMQVEFIKR